MTTEKTENTSSAGLILTDSAVEQIRRLQEKQENPNLFLRITVLGGGCSGFQYDVRLDETQQGDDLVFERNGVRVVTDPVSLDLIKGAEVKFVKELIGSAFIIENPNASSRCGCGVSFSL